MEARKIYWQSESGDERLWINCSSVDVLICRDFLDPEIGWITDDFFLLDYHQLSETSAALSDASKPPAPQDEAIEISGLKEPLQLA